MDSVAGADEGLLQFLYLAPIGILQTTRDGTIEMCNPRSAQLLMPAVHDGRIDNLFDCLAPYVPQLRSLVEQFTATAGVVCDGMRFTVSAVDGPSVYSLHLTKIDDDRLMGIVDDVTLEEAREREELDRRLHKAARVDALTAMPNRVAVRELMDKVLATPAEASRGHCAVVLVGVERLQQLADSFGEPVRDEVLNLMAARLGAVLRSDRDSDRTGGLAARGGEDEFVVFLRHLSVPRDATVIAQRVHDALARPYTIGSAQLHCTLSAGVVQMSGREESSEAVLRDAAIALGEAKRAGGSRWVTFEAAMRDRAIERGNLELDLRRALVDDELFVVYQPVIDLRDPDSSGRPAGVEALVRWRHPQRGVVPPIEFIGIAEETGLIGPLGKFVLDTACRDFTAWSKEFGSRSPELLAVNLSRAQLSDASLVDAVSRAVADSGMPIERLQLEITESLAAQGDDVRATLHALKHLGLTLALDDFGTGYSSLSSLHLLPVDTVKIDRSFVTLVEASAHHRVLIEATIKVSRSLGMTTVAEGIESEAQAQIVRDLGCDKAQGYRYSRPLPAGELRDWLLRWCGEAS